MDADGSNQTNLTSHPGFDLTCTWSPDGAKIAFNTSRDGLSDIYVMNADGSNQVNLTNHPAAFHVLGGWSRTGALFTFASDRTSNFEIYFMNADGTGVTQVTNNPARDTSPAWRR
jgi:TolB protein